MRVDFLFVAFEDKGIGIPREHIGKVFDKLYRVPTGNVHDVKGFGLGLSYVQAVMQQHGAEIDVVSTAGEGSTFTLVFPQKKKTVMKQQLDILALRGRSQPGKAAVATF